MALQTQEWRHAVKLLVTALVTSFTQNSTNLKTPADSQTSATPWFLGDAQCTLLKCTEFQQLLICYSKAYKLALRISARTLFAQE